MPDAALPRWTRSRFLLWSRSRAFGGTKATAALFHMTAQTLRNWERAPEDDVPPHVLLCVEAIEVLLGTPGVGLRPWLPVPALAWFDRWRERNGFGSSRTQAADALELHRQTVFKWYARGTLPEWLPLACLGYELRRSGARAVEGLEPLFLSKSLHSP